VARSSHSDGDLLELVAKRKAGNAPPLTDPTTGLTFPDLNADGELTQTNLIMPEPTIFLDRKFPRVSIIRPTETDGAAMARSKP
jgi:hypothetical protein